MRARTLLYIFAACSPAFLLCLLGISGRFLVMPWVSPEYGPKTSSEILAYRLPLMLEQSLWEGNEEPTDELVMAVASVWISAHNRGIIHDFEPASVFDLGATGVRGQILDSRNRILQSLQEIAAKSKRTGDNNRALESSTAILELAEVLKYSSPNAISSSANYQTKAIERLAFLEGERNQNDELKYQNAVEKIKPSFELLVSRFERTNTLAREDAISGRPGPLSKVTLEEVLNAKGGDLLAAADGNLDQLAVIYAFRKAFEQEGRLQASVQTGIALKNSDPLSQSESRIRLSVRSKTSQSKSTTPANSLSHQFGQSSNQSPLTHH